MFFWSKFEDICWLKLGDVFLDRQNNKKAIFFGELFVSFGVSSHVW